MYHNCVSCMVRNNFIYNSTSIFYVVTCLHISWWFIEILSIGRLWSCYTNMLPVLWFLSWVCFMLYDTAMCYKVDAALEYLIIIFFSFFSFTLFLVFYFYLSQSLISSPLISTHLISHVIIIHLKFFFFDKIILLRKCWLDRHSSFCEKLSKICNFFFFFLIMNFIKISNFSTNYWKRH